jgi:hypothetical protein
MKTLQDVIQHLAMQAEKDRLKEIESQQKTVVDGVIKLNSAIFSEAQRYTNVVLIAGYAAFFSMWSSMKDKLPTQPMLWVALLMTLSGGVFIAFEVYKMIVNQISYGYLQKFLKKPVGTPVAEFKAALEEYQRDSELLVLKVVGVWRYVLGITLATAIGAWVILVGFFALSLINDHPVLT